MSTHRRSPSLSESRYRPYNALLSPVRALQRLVTRSLSASSSAFSLNPPRVAPASLTTSSETPAEQVANPASSETGEMKPTPYNFGSVREPDAGPKDNGKEFTSGDQQASHDPTRPSNKSESEPSPTPETQTLVEEAGREPKKVLDTEVGVTEPSYKAREEGQSNAKMETKGADIEKADVVSYAADQERRESQADAKSVSAIIGGEDLALEADENTLEDGELVEDISAEEDEIVDVDPEPLTTTIKSFFGDHLMIPLTHFVRDKCLHWLGRIEGEVMAEDGLYAHTWRTTSWSMNSFTAIRGVRIYHFFDTIQSGFVTYSPPLRYGPISRWNFYPEHVTSGATNVFQRTSGDIEFWVDGDKFKYYIWTHLDCGDEILIDGEVGTPHPEIPGYVLHHHYNQPPMWLYQPKPRSPINLAHLRA
ncbi:hypothetical protein FRC11_005442 [Ceratobasidium sp. 423]|nr:hypothetical protein FRC11_005442 [Ceratobasidium sp. 423]